MGGAVQTVFGGGQEAGILGTGQYKADVAQVNRQDFEKDKEIKEREKAMAKALSKATKFEEPMAKSAQINQNPQEQFRQQQLGLSQALQQQAAGQGPSLAGAQLQQARDQNIATQMALAASGRGQNAALAQRQVAQQAAGAQQMAARDAATMRIQEQLAARDQLSGVLQAGRGQDIGLATSQAELQQQTALANQQAQLDAERIRNQAEQFYNQQLMGSAQADRDALMAYNQQNVQRSLGQNQINAGAHASASQARGGLMSGIGAAIAASDEDLKKNVKEADPKKEGKEEKTSMQKAGEAFSKSYAPAGGGNSHFGLGKALGSLASDKNLKKDVSSGEKGLKSFLDALTAYEYEYKDKKHGEGKFISPMAQDLEKTKIGKQAVLDTPEGKMVDYGKLGGAMLASQAMLNDRLGDLEKALKASKKGKK